MNHPEIIIPQEQEMKNAQSGIHQPIWQSLPDIIWLQILSHLFRGDLLSCLHVARFIFIPAARVLYYSPIVSNEPINLSKYEIYIKKLVISDRNHSPNLILDILSQSIHLKHLQISICNSSSIPFLIKYVNCLKSFNLRFFLLTSHLTKIHFDDPIAWQHQLDGICARLPQNCVTEFNIYESLSLISFVKSFVSAGNHVSKLALQSMLHGSGNIPASLLYHISDYSTSLKYLVLRNFYMDDSDLTVLYDVMIKCQLSQLSFTNCRLSCSYEYPCMFGSCLSLENLRLLHSDSLEQYLISFLPSNLKSLAVSNLDSPYDFRSIRIQCPYLNEFTWGFYSIDKWNDIFSEFYGSHERLNEISIHPYIWPEILSVYLTIKVSNQDSVVHLDSIGMFLALFPNATKIRLWILGNSTVNLLELILRVVSFIEKVQVLTLIVGRQGYTFKDRLFIELISSLPNLKNFQAKGSFIGPRAEVKQLLKEKYPCINFAWNC